MKIIITTMLLLISFSINAQNSMTDSLPYHSIPEAPKTYTQGAIIARMIDGLGFRYRWATEDLTEKNLMYSPGNEGRTIGQTIDHIYALSNVILNSAKKQPNVKPATPEKLGAAEQRLQTLMNFKEASMLFANTSDIEAHNVVFKNEKGESSFPFWNAINGPIEDAIWHAGQIVVLRRSDGNPINPKVNVFLGVLND